MWSSAYDNSKSDPPNAADDLYIGIYLVIILLVILMTVARMVWQYFLSLVASMSLFQKLLNAILRSPLRFFDTNPLYRIMTRFSKDLRVVDQALVMVISGFLTNLISAVSVLAVISAVTYEFLWAASVVGMFFSNFKMEYIR